MGTPFDEVTQQSLATFHSLLRLRISDALGQSDVNQFQRHLGDTGVGLQSPRNQRRLPPERGLGAHDGCPCSSEIPVTEVDPGRRSLHPGGVDPLPCLRRRGGRVAEA